MEICHLNESIVSVIIPISHTITNSETLKVGLEDGVISGMSSVVLINRIGKIGNVYSSIRLTADVKLVLFKFREFVKPSEKSSQVVLSRFIVIKRALFD